MTRNQDVMIDELAGHLSRVSETSKKIHEHVVDQNRQIAEMDQEMDNTNAGVKFISERTQFVVNQAGGPRPCKIIIGLSIVAIVLLFLVIYT